MSADFDIDGLLDAMQPRKEALQIQETEEEQEDKVVAYPELYTALLLFAHDTRTRMILHGHAWERRIMHTIAGYLGLLHDTQKHGKSGIHVVTVSKPVEYKPRFALGPQSQWDAETLNCNPSESIYHYMKQFPELFFAVSKVSAIDKDTTKPIMFPPTLSEEQCEALSAFASYFHVSLLAIRENGVIYCTLAPLANSTTRDHDACQRQKPKFDAGNIVFPDSMPQVLHDIIETQRVVCQDGSTVAATAGVSHRAGSYLYHLITDMGLSNTLEIGLAYGVSALYCCWALHAQRGHHTAIDPFQASEWKSIGMENVRRAGFEDRFVWTEASSDLELPRLAALKTSFDLIFIDGNHLFDAAFIDMYYSVRLLSKHGFLVFDDADMPSIRKVIRYCLRNYHNLVPYPPGCFDRIFTLRKIQPEDGRQWYFHADF